MLRILTSFSLYNRTDYGETGLKLDWLRPLLLAYPLMLISLRLLSIEPLFLIRILLKMLFIF